VLPAAKGSSGFANDMYLRASTHGGKLLLEADEENERTVWFVPGRSTARLPTLLSGSLTGNGKGWGEKVFD
jgi:hypothetical protein